MAIKPEDFDVYKNLLKSTSGLAVTPDKAYLLESRLGAVVRKWELDNIDALTAKLRTMPAKELVNDVMEAMTTNETSFFRDMHPFELFKDPIVPYLLGARAAMKRIRIWSAAASSGQESYSLSMTIKEMGSAVAGWSFPNKATDVSKDIIEQAKKGIYSQFEVQRGLPIQLMVKYFDQVDDKWQIKQEIRDMVQFDTFNLLHDMTPIGRQDIVFCRNVLIYFDEQDKTMILERIADLLEDDGFLILGGAETVLGLTDKLVPMPQKRGLYVKKGSVHLQTDSPLAKAPNYA